MAIIAAWWGEGRLDLATNYGCYKGLFSSLNERNYFEIAYAFNCQFGEDGIYRDLGLYVFAFLRVPSHPDGEVVVALNAAGTPATVDLRMACQSGRLVDRLNPGSIFRIENFKVRLDLPPTWARVLTIEANDSEIHA